MCSSIHIVTSCHLCSISYVKRCGASIKLWNSERTTYHVPLSASDIKTSEFPNDHVLVDFWKNQINLVEVQTDNLSRNTGCRSGVCKPPRVSRLMQDSTRNRARRYSRCSYRRHSRGVVFLMKGGRPNWQSIKCQWLQVTQKLKFLNPTQSPALMQESQRIESNRNEM